MTALRNLLRLFALTLGASALLLVGCGVWRPAKAPMHTHVDRSICNAKADTLLVFLPGASSDPQEFVREGFVRALRDRGIAADAMRVDAHMGYYNNHTIARRLEADFFIPAQASGYRAIWLVGISVGGFSISYPLAATRMRQTEYRLCQGFEDENEHLTRV